MNLYLKSGSNRYKKFGVADSARFRVRRGSGRFFVRSQFCKPDHGGEEVFGADVDGVAAGCGGNFSKAGIWKPAFEGGRRMVQGDDNEKSQSRF